jgi:predicted nucleic acid-binding protein
MRIVIDANILFAACIRDGMTAKLLFSDAIEPHAPAHIIREFETYKELIGQKTSRKEFDTFLDVLWRWIRIIPDTEIVPFIPDVLSPDPGDAYFLALALKLNCPLWSNDNDLKRQDAVRVYTTTELAGMID